MPALPWTSRREPEPGATYVVMGSMLPLRGDRLVPIVGRGRAAECGAIAWHIPGFSRPVRLPKGRPIVPRWPER
jgi:hypothetical protein